MSTNRSTVPKLRLHNKATGQALVVIDGKSINLGKHRTALAQEESDRLISEWLCNGRQFGFRLPGPTIAELILACCHYSQTYFRKNDTTPDELYGIKAAMRPQKKAYGLLCLCR
ncbi:MAG: hypothetical protein ACE5EQ_08195 [Phycisphaerae bacterium]